MEQGEREHAAYNALNLAAEANGRLIARLKSAYGNYRTAWDQTDRSSPAFTDPDIAERFFKRRASIDPAAEWERLEKLKIALVLLGDNEYPELLKESGDAPLGLYVQGTLPASPAGGPKDKTLAVVGTRKVSAYGKSACAELTSALARAGVHVVSGLAYGIDAVAHRTSLETGGLTSGVIASGIDVLYPSSHTSLANAMIDSGGSVISEFPLGTAPLRRYFPQRNRVVSGMSHGVVVIEAPERSGSLITASFAVEQNRDVFVVPGPVSSAQYRGSHRLIQEGAKLIMSADDILSELGWDGGSGASEHLTFSSPEEAQIHKLLTAAAEPLSIDGIMRITRFDAARVSVVLSELALKKAVQEVNGRFSAT